MTLDARKTDAFQSELREIERAATELRWLFRRVLQPEILQPENQTVEEENHATTARSPTSANPIQSAPNRAN